MLPRLHFSIERWRKNIEYGVWVSNQGNVRLIKNKQYLNPRINENGYCIVFTEQGAILVHRLVAYTWLGGKRNAKYTVDHINSNKRDNSVKNLRWFELDLNREYANFTQYACKNVKESKPQQCIEEDEAKKTLVYKRHEELKKIPIIFDGDKSKEERVGKLLTLWRTDSIKILFDNVEVKDYNELLIRKISMAPTVTDIDFVYRILLAIYNARAYCGGKWDIKEVLHETI